MSDNFKWASCGFALRMGVLISEGRLSGLSIYPVVKERPTRCLRFVENLCLLSLRKRNMSSIAEGGNKYKYQSVTAGLPGWSNRSSLRLFAIILHFHAQCTVSSLMTVQLPKATSGMERERQIPPQILWKCFNDLDQGFSSSNPHISDIGNIQHTLFSSLVTLWRSFWLYELNWVC